MATTGWTRTESPFHAGEQAIQARFGAQEQMDKLGRRMIREYFPDQHRQFFAQLPYLIVGTVDTAGNPWASILVGNPGFLSTEERLLRVQAQPLPGDPLGEILADGIDIGFLGIDLKTRRRNRVNGVVSAIHPDGFEVQVRQTFGNCPKYIQERLFESVEPTINPPRHAIASLSAPEKDLITAADTFFIATAYQDPSAGLASGVDVSHRGGNAGFIRIDGNDTLTVPDFAGNCHFNTFGNIELNPRAGLLFVDFEQGDLLYLTGHARVIWEGPEIAIYEGAERLLRFQMTQGYRVEGGLPLRWSAPDFSPFLAQTGPWSSNSQT